MRCCNGSLTQTPYDVLLLSAGVDFATVVEPRSSTRLLGCCDEVNIVNDHRDLPGNDLEHFLRNQCGAFDERDHWRLH